MNKFNTYVIFFQMNNNEEHETCRSVHINLDITEQDAKILTRGDWQTILCNITNAFLKHDPWQNTREMFAPDEFDIWYVFIYQGDQ